MDTDLGSKGLNSAMGHKRKLKILYLTIRLHIGSCLKTQWHCDVMGRTQHTLSSQGVGNKCQMPVQSTDANFTRVKFKSMSIPVYISHTSDTV